jgi:hypothetical protein
VHLFGLYSKITYAFLHNLKLSAKYTSFFNNPKNFEILNNGNLILGYDLAANSKQNSAFESCVQNPKS